LDLQSITMEHSRMKFILDLKFLTLVLFKLQRFQSCPLDQLIQRMLNLLTEGENEAFDEGSLQDIIIVRCSAVLIEI
jgi:hypothetical protein